MFNELELIEQPAIALFQSLGYSYQDCFHEIYGTKGTLGRETSTDVILIPKLREALYTLNPDIPNDAIEHAIEELTRDRSVLNPVNANREIYKLIRDGVKVQGTTLTPALSHREKEEIGESDVTVRVIDWNNPENNDFFLASQFWITGDMYKRRADLVGFVNGLPLIFIELKAVHRKLENAFKDNITDYKDTVPQVFRYNAFIIISNGSESKIGTATSEYEHFNEWKKINSEGEEGIVSLETIIKGTCDKRKLLDLIENFILYSDTGGSLIKIIAKNHQFLIYNFKQSADDNATVPLYYENRIPEVQLKNEDLNEDLERIIEEALLSPEQEEKLQREFAREYHIITRDDRLEKIAGDIVTHFINRGVNIEKIINVKTPLMASLQKIRAEEELAVFDLLKKPELNKKEIQQIKLASKDLLIKLKKEKLVLDWRRKQQTRADVFITIEKILDEMLPRSYPPDLYQQKCTTVYQHVYESYYGAGRSIYT